jgi:hypothetical protein
MKSDPSNQITDLLRILNNCVINLGANKVTNYLKWLNDISIDEKSLINEVIIFEVCERYNLTFDELLNNNRNDGDKNDAFCLISALLKKHSSLSQNQIATLLNRHKSQISKYITRMSKLNPLMRSDSKIYNEYLEIEKSIIAILNNNQFKWKKEGEADLGNPNQ